MLTLFHNLIKEGAKEASVLVSSLLLRRRVEDALTIIPLDHTPVVYHGTDVT